MWRNWNSYIAGESVYFYKHYGKLLNYPLILNLCISFDLKILLFVFSTQASTPTAREQTPSPTGQ